MASWSTPVPRKRRGTAEWEAAVQMVTTLPRQVTLGADKGYDNARVRQGSPGARGDAAHGPEHVEPDVSRPPRDVRFSVSSGLIESLRLADDWMLEIACEEEC
jgi:hypothetical protein